MFTVTMGRTLCALSLTGAVAVASSTAAAQVIVRTDGAGIVGARVNAIAHRAVSVSDDSVRSYLTRFEPGVLDDDSGDASIVTIVLDNDGTYVRSSSRHAKIIQALPGRIISINGDTARALEAGAARVFSINGDSLKAITIGSNVDGPAIATIGSLVAGSVVAVNGLHRASGAAMPGMLADVSADEIGGIATKHYAPGEMGRGPVLVTFIYLK